MYDKWERWYGISIHASLAGGDNVPGDQLAGEVISIHASLAGGDHVTDM